MTQTTIISIEGQDKFSGVSAQAADAVNKLGSAVSSFPSAANAGISATGGLAGAIGNMATVAGGIIASQVFTRIADGITGFISTGLSAVGSSQMLEASLRSLMTANNMYAMSTETATVATTKQVMSQSDMEIKARELNATLITQRATFQEQAEKIRQLTDQYGDNGLVVIKNKAQHEELRLAIQDTERDIAGLTTSVTTYGTETRTSYTQVMSMADAQRIARRETDDLMQSISEIAVVSPFETQDVEMVAKYAVAAGMGAGATKDFTAGFLDMAAAVGIASPNLGFAADQLLQVKKAGKLTEIDLRQLRRMGIDVGKVLGVEMGMSVDEFNKKAGESPEAFDDLFTAMTRFSQNTFAGTASEMALSVKGLQSTVNDIFVIGARSFFRPLVEAVSPAMAEFVGKISDAVLGGSMSTLGERAAEMLTKGLGKAGAIFRAFGRSPDEGFRMIVYEFGKIWPGIESQLITWGGMFWNWISDTVIPAGSSVLTSLTNAIGGWLLNQWDTNIAPQLIEWGNKFWNWVAILYPQIPGLLTGLTQGIATYLTDNWPTISAALFEWSAKFWEWVNIAAAAAGTALTALGVAMMAWAQSGEAQTSMKEMGQNLGTMIVDALKLNFEGGEGAGNAMSALTQGLVNAVGGIVGTLIILGGELVAGILDGLLTSLGVDLEPATFKELGGILSGIGNNIKTIASKLGENIIKGIVKGINDNVSQVFEVIKSMAMTAISEAKSALGISSPSKPFAEMGREIIAGLVSTVTAGIPDFQGVLDKLLNLKHVSTGFRDVWGQARDDVEKSMDEWMPEEKVKFALQAMSKMMKDNAAFAATATDAQLKDMLMKSVGSWAQAGIMNAERMVGDAVNIFRETGERIQEEAQAAVAENFNKMMAGIGQFASAATQEADALARKISVLDTLLRQGGETFNIEGHIMDAAQAQARLNQLVAEQVAMQPDLAGITGFQAGMQNMQEQQALLAGLSAPVDQAAGAIVGGLNQLTGFLGQQIMAMMGSQLGIPGGGTTTSGTGGGGVVGGNQTNISFAPTINTTADEQSIIQLFYQMMAMVPSGT